MRGAGTWKTKEVHGPFAPPRTWSRGARASPTASEYRLRKGDPRTPRRCRPKALSTHHRVRRRGGDPVGAAAGRRAPRPASATATSASGASERRPDRRGAPPRRRRVARVASAQNESKGGETQRRRENMSKVRRSERHVGGKFKINPNSEARSGHQALAMRTAREAADRRRQQTMTRFSCQTASLRTQRAPGGPCINSSLCGNRPDGV